MAKYRRRTPTIEAFVLMVDPTPEWYQQLIERRCVQVQGNHHEVGTFRGWRTAKKGDYIIRDIRGEPYPLKPDVFKEAYEPVEE